MPERNHEQLPRVLHVTSALDPGGIETWLLRLVQHTGDAQLATAVLVLGGHEGLLAPRFRERGVQIMRVGLEGNCLQFIGRVSQAIAESGPWGVVHSHVHRRSALVQLAAAWQGVPLRITHSHNSYGQDDAYAWWFRELGRRTATTAIKWLSHQLLACSTQSARALFGKAAARSGDYVHMPYGLDEEAFLAAGALPAHATRHSVRAQLGIPEHARVIGHIGRFMPQKNHTYLLQVAAEALRARPDLHFLLVGDGPLRSEMEALAAALGIAGQVTFAGHRLDIPLLMRHSMDCFFFPSRWEGLGIVLLEAQVAGLPCFLSDRVPQEANVFPARNCHFSVDASPAQTARELVVFAETRVTARQCADNVTTTRIPLPAGYQIWHNTALLAALYRRIEPGRKARRLRRNEQPA
ncbi:MAG: glycosyltransferase [Bryobacterales bacterium]|nr:glycosyltransferase [Bryobacterales bacterium]